MEIINNIYDIPELKYLKPIADRYRVEFILFGSTVRRLVSGFVNGRYTSSEPSLFDLAPFTSDIDFIHSGKSKLTGRIIHDIFNEMPNADLFRWELKSRKEHKEYRNASLYNAIVPVNLMALTSTSTGLIDPWGGMKDIKENKYRLIRNGFYRSSPLFREGKDLEFLAVILYLRALVESGQSVWHDQPGWEDAANILKDAQTQTTIIRMQESAYLRSRLRYLLKGLAGSLLGRAGASKISEESGLLGLLKFIDASLGMTSSFEGEIARDENTVIVSSSRLDGDTFRLENRSQTWWGAGKSTDDFGQLLLGPRIIQNNSYKQNVLEFIDDVKLEWRHDERIEIILSSPDLKLAKGIGSCSKLVDSESEYGTVTSNQDPSDQPISQEFLCFAIPSPNEYADVKDEDVSAILTLKVNTACDFFPLGTACTIARDNSKQNGRVVFVRINVGRILEQAHDYCIKYRQTVDVVAQIFIVLLKPAGAIAIKTLQI